MSWKAGLLIALVSSIVTLGCTTALAQRAHPSAVVHGSFSDLQWQPLPEFGGEEAIIYRSQDGTRVAAAFRESGRHAFTYPFDEFLYVTRGSVVVHVEGGNTFTLSAGDYAYFQTGTRVEFEFSDDFEDLTMLMSDQAVSWR